MAIPRLQDALQTLAIAVSGALNTAGIAAPNQVGPGEPDAIALVKILNGQGYQVLLHDRGATRDMSRFEMDTFTVTNPESPLVATISGAALTFSGSVVAGLNVHTFVGSPIQDAYLQTGSTDTLDTVAAGVAGTVNALGLPGVSASASGAVVTFVGAPPLFCNIGGVGLVMATEVARLRRSIQVTCWCPNPVLRFAVLDAIESQIGTQLQPFLYLSDGTCMQVEFATSNTSAGTLRDDKSQSYSAFIANIVYDCEYAVLAYSPAGEVESIDNTVAVNNEDPASVVVGGPPANQFALPTPAAPPAPPGPSQAGFPPFSWATVPTAVQMGKSTGDFDSAELGFMSSRFDAVFLGNAGTDQYIEPGIYRNAAALKALNPAMKVGIYWGFHGGKTDYQAFTVWPGFQESWYVDNPNGHGSTILDITNPAFREWWAGAAANMVVSGGLDGMFIDGIGGPWDPNVYDILLRFRTKLNAQMSHGLIIGNGASSAGLPSDPLNYFNGVLDGSYIEGDDLLGGGVSDPTKLVQHVTDMIALGKAGYLTILHGWPGFGPSPHQANPPANYFDAVAEARASISVPLAAFLCGAYEYSYFQYSWGYGYKEGQYVCSNDPTEVAPDDVAIDASWYAQLLRDLGSPTADAYNPPASGPSGPGGTTGASGGGGYVYVNQFARAFQHGSVFVDLENLVATITYT